MENLNSVVHFIFQNSSGRSRIMQRYIRDTNSTPITSKKYMEIPISSDEFELPLLAFEDFKNMQRNKKTGDVIVASLYSCGQTSNYKSLDSIMKDVLSTYFNRHLCKIQMVNSPKVYYATFGTIFDEGFTPLMMMSWIMQRRANAEGVVKYHFKEPLLRLDPYPCLNKEDAIQRFICGKMMTATLGTAVLPPYGCSDFMEQYSYLKFNHAKVEIDECPFTIRGTDVPSISVTNEDLLQLAADHIDEILQ